MSKLKPALQYSAGRSLPWSGARLVNAFAEKADGDKRDDFAVMAIPGTTLYVAVGSGPIRGMCVYDGSLHVVSGDKLYRMNGTGAATLLGTLTNSTGKVRMVTNGSAHLCIADTDAYVWDGTTLHDTAALGLPADVSDVAYIDGYIIWTFVDTDQFIISALDNATVYDLLDIATVEGAPDNLVGVIVDHREVQFYGTATVEIWYNSGASDFPFERQGNAFIERGCFDRDSMVKIDNSVHFVGDDRIVYRLAGYDPLRISTHAIEYAMRNAAWYRAYTYTQEGHKFYIIATADGTFCFDMATGAWHERQSTGLDYWRMGEACVFGNTLYFGDSVNGNIYTTSLDTDSENAGDIAVTIELPTLEADNRQRITMHSFEMLCETGEDAAPTATLSWSDDGGRTYSSGVARSLGAAAAYTTRVIWRKLGQFRQRQIRIVMTGQFRRMVIAYFADVR